MRLILLIMTLLLLVCEKERLEDGKYQNSEKLQYGKDEGGQHCRSEVFQERKERERIKNSIKM